MSRPPALTVAQVEHLRWVLAGEVYVPSEFREDRRPFHAAGLPVRQPTLVKLAVLGLVTKPTVQRTDRPYLPTQSGRALLATLDGAA